MIVAGKCKPEPDRFRELREKGFENVELYLKKHHVDNFEQTLARCREAEINISSVHTPHVLPEDEEYFVKSDELADKLDATLVVHSQYLHHFHIEKVLENYNFQSDYAYENNPGMSIPHLEKMIPNAGHQMVLDTAHLYMSSDQKFQEHLDHFLNNHRKQISLIHVCDSTMKNDGLPFGEGKMNMEQTIKTIKEKFDGKITLEVMPKRQEDALEKWNSNF
ncbi:MAG: hypothetical protein ACI977_000773 [Candidatus Nanohaloarchaea archaeon]|jgi:hypothetical protein